MHVEQLPQVLTVSLCQITAVVSWTACLPPSISYQKSSPPSAVTYPSSLTAAFGVALTSSKRWLSALTQS